ncbi:MAG: pyridoxal-phosphate dependent enzyme [Bacteroidota bacterium]
MVSLPTPIQKITHPLLKEKNIHVWVKRDDLIHEEIMGNKWRKLKYNLNQMRVNGQDKLVTMGGAFSNHIAATAAASKEFKFEAVGLIRGEELNENSNPTLKKATQSGMSFQFLDRVTFKNLRENPEKVKEQFPNHYFLPEGGTNKLAIKGCEEVLSEIDFDFDLLVTPIGTGGTFCGLLSGLEASKHLIGVSTLKGSFIYNEMEEMLKTYKISKKNYSILEHYHFGGYGKFTSKLIDFINWFKENFEIQLEPIYTGKSFFAVWDMIKNNKFEKNIKIVLLHTGGIQGISGFNRKNENIVQ